jgi:hypothetical protein
MLTREGRLIFCYFQSLFYHFYKIQSKDMNKLFLWLILSVALAIPLAGQYTYPTEKEIETRLKAHAKVLGNMAKVQSIGKSAGGLDLWMISLYQEDMSSKPSLLVVSGTDGLHPSGTLVSLSLLDALVALGTDTLRQYLSKASLHILPSLNPDALNSYGEKVKMVRRGNGTPFDEDRDGWLEEDPFEDLNGDGYITQMRVEDSAGEYRMWEKDPRVMVKADFTKGEFATHRLLSEGIDNDKDGKFNEDGKGGVNIDRNFSYDYPIFSEGAGPYQSSESETRSFLEFLFRNPEVHTVLHIGMHDNLTTPEKYDEKLTSGRIVKSWLESDAKVSSLLSKRYKDLLGIENDKIHPLDAVGGGDLSQTVYYHAGRFSLATPSWWIPVFQDSASSQNSSQSLKKEKQLGSKEYSLLKWSEAHGVSDVFFDWQPYSHPDFPNQKVEIGGFFPLALHNPPSDIAEKRGAQHVPFVKMLLASMPEVVLENIKVDKLDKEVYRVSVDIVNRGGLPTSSALGHKIRFVEKLKTSLVLQPKQQLLSGKILDLTEPLMPGERKEYSWLIKGKGDMVIESGNATSGKKSHTITLQ